MVAATTLPGLDGGMLVLPILEQSSVVLSPPPQEQMLKISRDNAVAKIILFIHSSG
jgi:hypothetical protein